MTKIWRQSESENDRTEAYIADCDWELVRDEPLGVSRWDAANSSRPTIVEIESDHPPNDYFDASSMFVVSDRLKQLFEEFAVHAEHLAIRIVYEGNEYEEQRFFCCNILDAVECFDFERGQCTFHQAAGFTDHIDKIEKLAINEAKASRYDLFRIAKGGEYIVCASDALADGITTSGLTGMVFVKPEDWSMC